MDHPTAPATAEHPTPRPSPGGPRTSSHLAGWARRIGVAGFAFFLVKGLLWLTVPALIAHRALRASPSAGDRPPAVDAVE